MNNDVYLNNDSRKIFENYLAEQVPPAAPAAAPAAGAAPAAAGASDPGAALADLIAKDPKIIAQLGQLKEVQAFIAKVAPPAAAAAAATERAARANMYGQIGGALVKGTNIFGT